MKAQNDLVRYKQLVDKQEVSQQQYDQAVAAASASTASVASASASAAAAAQQVHAGAQPVLRRRRRTFARRRPARSRWLRRKPALVPPTPTVAGKAGGARTGRIESPIHKNRGAGGRRGDEKRGSGNERPAGPAIVHDRAARRRLGHGEFQGNAAEIHAARAARGESKWTPTAATYKGHVDSIAGSSGARLSLLPPENATGNYVKVVQRVPVKIVLEPGENNDHYLRLGMSVEPKVYVK